MDRFANLISGGLRGPAAGAHPDADVLAAFAEGLLSPAERDPLLLHLGACSDCRHVLYLASPPSSELPHDVPVSRPRRSGLVLRWGTALASVAILALVFVTHSGRKSAQSSLPQLAAEKSPQEFDRLAARDSIAPSTTNEAKAAQETRPQAKHMTAAPTAKLRFDQSGEVHLAAPVSASLNDKKNKNKEEDLDRAQLGKDQAADLKAKSANRVTSGSEVGTETGGLAPASEPAKVMADGTRRAPAVAEAAPAAYARAEAAQQVGISAGAQWRISPAGAIERSMDVGKTWQTVTVANGSAFQAVSVSGASVWTGGRAGTLYHSLDGGGVWSRVEPVERGQKLTADITRIDFSDSLNGAITTANGEVWSTADGGATWSRK